MSTNQSINNTSGLYLITFTCAKWLPLFEITNSYDLVYNWFNYLKTIDCKIVGFGIMPNHIHALIDFPKTNKKSINTIVGNGKRFMAYDIVERLKGSENFEILQKLSELVSISDQKKGKLHEVFESSFDWKECHEPWFIEQKLAYIHNNPCSGKWNLAKSPQDYVHSSACFYILGYQGIYEINHYQDV